MPSRIRHSIALALAVMLAPVLLVLGIWLGGHPDSLPGPIRDALTGNGSDRVVRQALDEVHDNYFRAVPRDQLANAAIAGMVRSLNDRFSNYFTPSQYRSFQQDTDAQFTGVGMEVTAARTGLRVVHVYPGSPAQKGGLRPGDVIVAVDGRSLHGVSERVSSGLIRGPEGSHVRLTFVSGRDRVTRTFTRATVSVPVVAWKMLTLPGGTKVAHVALSTFSSGAHAQLRQAIDRALKRGAKGIVFDLRDNGGGLVEEARLIASIFIPDGTIVTTRGRAQPTQTLTATGGAISTKIPVVMLVNRDTASAAEIVTGALQDHHRATVVGTHTFGKGVFQEVKTLPNGGALDITVGRYFTPDGHNLGGVGVKQGAGITPNVRASDDPRTPNRDEALDAALRVLARDLAHR